MKRLKQIEKRKLLNWVSRLIVVISVSYVILLQHKSIQQLSEQIVYLNTKVINHDLLVKDCMNNIPENNIIKHTTKSSQQVAVQKHLKRIYHYYIDMDQNSEAPNIFHNLIMFETEESNEDKYKQLILNAMFSSELGFVGWEEIMFEFKNWLSQVQDETLTTMLQEMIEMDVLENI